MSNQETQRRVYVTINKPSDVKTKKTSIEVLKYIEQGYKTFEIDLQFAYIAEEKYYLQTMDEFRKIKNKLALSRLGV